MRLNMELENIRMHARQQDMEIAHIKRVIAKIRSDEKSDFDMETDLIRKLRERVETLENKLADLEARLPS